ncbi:hypothetical protein QFC24_003317 [Naganishia onofrii]|uniref:Uncharacterized protein n=1 Tax=Naganishia onofrii TaxID=1851511 RepID=A0ACC2XKH3_9TREE|nr:hypothetical protein QFC24_003317 [Naganishia onofrii]
MEEGKEEHTSSPTPGYQDAARPTSDGPLVESGRYEEPDSVSTTPSNNASSGREITRPSGNDRDTAGSTTAVDVRARSLDAFESTPIRITTKSVNHYEGNSRPHPGFYVSRQPVDSYSQHSDSDFKDVSNNSRVPYDSAEARDRRLKAIQDLSLEPSDLPLRRQTFCEYVELVKKIFRTASAMVNIMRAEDAYIIMDKGPLRIADLQMTLCSRTLNDTEHKGIAVHDVNQDSAIHQSPIWDQLADYPIKFYAGAPMIVHLPNSPPAVIGTLCVLDEKPRPDFTEESLEILAQLASMLVKSICAEQSEIYAQKVARMHAVTCDFMERAIMPDPIRANGRRQSNEEVYPRCPADKPTGRYREGKAWDSAEVKVDSLLVEPEDGDENEDDINDSIYEQAILSICEIMDDSAVALLDTSSYRVYFRQSGSDVNDHVLEHLTENIGSKGFLDSDMGSRLSRLPDSLKDIADKDIVVKKIERSQEERTAMPSEVIAFRLADVAFQSPFKLDATESSEFTDAICDILGKALRSSPLWLNREDRDPQSIAIFRRIAPQAACMLVHPLWNPDGSPLKLLLIAWRNDCQRKHEIESFTTSIMTGLTAGLTLHKARRMEQAQIAFGNVQAHAMQNLEMKGGLEDIENASIQLETVMRNILSYFELESDFSPAQVRWEAFAMERKAPRTLEETLNDVLLTLAKRDTKQRENNARKTPNIEVVLEIIPPFLGDTLEEDISGNFARSIGNIVQNALAYIEDAEGYVLIAVDDVASLLPPQGFSDVSTTKNVSIKIMDSGAGMNEDYLKYHYFRPLKKGNELRAGSGLSVHVARRLLKTLGGSIAVSSQAGKGTTVHIEVPLTRRPSPAAITAQHNSSNPDPIAIQILEIGTPRNVHLLGFFDESSTKGIRCAGEVLIRSIERLGCKSVEKLNDADFVFFNVGKRNPAQVQQSLMSYGARQVIFLFKDEQSRLDFDTSGLDYDIVCLHRPLLPSTLRSLLFQAEETHQKAGVKPPQNFKATEEVGGTVAAAAAFMEGEQKSTLPAVTASPDRRKVANSQDDSKRNQIPVIVVEDNRIVVLLESQNLGTISEENACDGEEAVQIFRDLQEPCIGENFLLDINMPNLDGFEASKLMRKIESEFPERRVSQIVAVTALNGNDHRDRGVQECGMDAWLVKPTSKKQIVDAVEQGMKALSVAA